jgi:preprotein translocase subunit SecD
MLTVTVLVIVGWFVATLLSDNRPVLGLDLQGGTSIVLAPVKGSDTSGLDGAINVIRNRVDGLGVAEPDVSRQGNNIVVDLPGAKNARQAQELVGKTAELRFRPVLGNIPWSASPTTSTTAKGATTTTVKGATTTKPETSTTLKGDSAPKERSIDAEPIALRTQQVSTTTAAPATTTPTTVKGATTTTVPSAADQSCQEGKAATENASDLSMRDKQVIIPDLRKDLCYVLGPALMTGRDISSADKIVNPQSAAWEVQVKFKNDDFVNKVAKPYVGQLVAIELDGVVQSAPRINEGITGRTVQITGDFSEKEAKDLALVLRYGSLPVQLEQQTAQSVSPTLGKDQLHAGIVAGVIGLALVAIYMIIFYRLLGLVVWIGLGLTGMVFFSLVTWLSTNQGLTLTLAGVTGIIVSVGVTVDSYVIYFERLKDEVRTGKTIRSSLDTGFTRAFRTILAADLVSLLGAGVLYFLAAGSVRGFAYFLALSTIIDLVLAYFFMHPMVYLMSRRPSLVRMKGVGIGAGLDVPEVRA